MKVGLITGAARRIGAEIARHLHSQGLNVVLHCHQSVKEANQLCDALNAKRSSSAKVLQADLQDHSQRKYQKTPFYKVVQESGPDHAKIFHVMVFVNDQEAGLGLGASKKEAEQRAAFDAMSKLPEVNL